MGLTPEQEQEARENFDAVRNGWWSVSGEIPRTRFVAKN